MTSVLNVDSIAAKDGTSPVGLTKQAALKCFFKTAGEYTGVVAGALNVSSITDVGTGDVDILFINAFATTNDVVPLGTVASNAARMCSVTGITTGQASFVSHNNNGADADNGIHGMVTGDLA